MQEGAKKKKGLGRRGREGRERYTHNCVQPSTNGLRYGSDTPQSSFPAGLEAADPARIEASTHMVLCMADAALQVPACTECLDPLSDARRDGPLSCRNWAVFEGLHHQVEELQEKIIRLHKIRDQRQGLLGDATV